MALVEQLGDDRLWVAYAACFYITLFLNKYGFCPLLFGFFFFFFFFPLLHVSVCSYASVRARARVCVCLSMVVYIYILFTCVLYKTNCNVTSVRSYNV